jgi:hypothetical protein
MNELVNAGTAVGWSFPKLVTCLNRACKCVERLLVSVQRSLAGAVSEPVRNITPMPHWERAAWISVWLGKSPRSRVPVNQGANILERAAGPVRDLFGGDQLLLNQRHDSHSTDALNFLDRGENSILNPLRVAMEIRTLNTIRSTEQGVAASGIEQRIEHIVIIQVSSLDDQGEAPRSHLFLPLCRMRAATHRAANLSRESFRILRR